MGEAGMTQHLMVEMSQDCVEWDESNNADLRFVDKSPPNGQGITREPPTTSSHSKSSKTRASLRTASLDTIKRHLGKDESSKHQDSVLSTQSPYKRREKLQRSEKEIDGILSCLEKEEALLAPEQISPPMIGASPDQKIRVVPLAQAPTQQTRNLKSAGQKWGVHNARLHEPSKASIPKSLMARQRRRRRETENVHPNQFSKRQNRTIPSEKDGSNVTSPQLDKPTTESIIEDEGGDFEEILKQMNTPQSDIKKSRSPLRTIPDDTDSSTPSSYQEARNMNLGKTESSLNSNNSLNCRASYDGVNETWSDNRPPSPPRRLHRAACDTNFPGARPTIESQMQEQTATSDTLNMPPPPIKKIHSPSNINPPVAESLSNKLRHTQQTSTAVKGDDQDDEFGDLNLGSLDFGDIDSLLDMQSSQHLAQCVGNDKIQTDHYSATQTVTPSVLNKAFVSEIESEADEFGCFPDIDFEALDEVIEKRQEHPSKSSGSMIPLEIKSQAPSSVMPEVSFLTFSRYKVLRVEEDISTYTKTLEVASWTVEMLNHDNEERLLHRNVRSTNLSPQQYKPSGHIHLRGEWYYTKVYEGDVFHLCSLSGRRKTDVAALPIVVHSSPSHGSDTDDLVVVMHPDLLVTPTIVSETVGCSRRAVLKNRFGSSGCMSKAALLGTMRHELFGMCIKEQKFDIDSAMKCSKKIVRRNATSLIACGMSVEEAEKGVVEVMPSIREFVSQYTRFGDDGAQTNFSDRPALNGHGHQDSIKFVADSVDAIEEPVVSPELALKGFVDATLSITAVTLNQQPSPLSVVESHGPQNFYSCLELKTGHNQNTQNAHMAQLALYTLMLQVRHGVKKNGHGRQESNRKIGILPTAAPGGILVYLNEKSTRSVHVSPLLNEIKSLIGQRNVIACEMKRSSRPRGIELTYQEPGEESDDTTSSVKLLPSPPAELPELLPNTRMCAKCYANRECMLYAATERLSATPDSSLEIERTHKDLLSAYTSHLNQEDLAYFNDWDRLIDLEADATSHNVATAWLLESARRESDTGESVSALVFEISESSSSGSGESSSLIAFRRSTTSATQTPFSSLSLTPGCQVIVSTDGTSFHSADRPYQDRPSQLFRHQMHVIRGSLERVEEDRILVQASKDDLDRIRRLCFRFIGIHTQSSMNCRPECLFRIDKDNISMGIGTLRQNLLNLFTGDRLKPGTKDDSDVNPRMSGRLQWLRDIVVRLRAPEFDKSSASSLFSCQKTSLNIPGCDLESLAFEYAEMNPDQRAAVEKVICAKDYALIQGLPGTGKTSTLAFVARLLAARGNRVLITSYTNTAVDNVVMKLAESGLTSDNTPTNLPSMIRIGHKASCHPSVHPILASELAMCLEKDTKEVGSEIYSIQSDGEIHQMELPSATSLLTVVRSARIVCTTALSVPRSPLLAGEDFDVVIVDEAGQISQPAILGPLMTSDLFILVGDHLQLPPLVNSEAAEQGGYGISMLKRLADAFPSSISPLTYQYRMNGEICQLSSDAVYDGRLKCASEDVALKLLELHDFPKSLPHLVSTTSIPWLTEVIDPARSVVFMDTDKLKSGTVTYKREVATRSGTGSMAEQIDALESRMGKRYDGKIVNQTEATLVRYIIKALMAVGLQAGDIGVVCPFRAQLKILEDSPSIQKWKREGVELSTIDRYQGRDKLVIIISFVRSNERGKAGRLLQDIRRLNVAMTRAKRKLFMIGSFSTLTSGSRVLKPVLEGIDMRNQRYILPHNARECYDIP